RGRGFRRSFNNSGNGCQGCRNQGYGCQGCGRQSFGNQEFGGQHRAFGYGFQRQRQPFMQEQFGQHGLNQIQQGFGQLAIGQGQANNNNVRPNGRAGRPSVNSVTTFLVGLLTLTLLPSATGLQVCGFGITGNLFVPPKPITCVFNPEIQLQRHQVHILTPKTNAIELPATKCFKRKVKASTMGILSIYQKIEMEIDADSQFDVSADECRKVAFDKKYESFPLEEIAPGFYRTNATSKVADFQSGWFGVNKSEFFEFTIQTGHVATIDGSTIISDLGQMNQCSFDAGSCKDGKFTVVWEPQLSRKECPFEYSYTTNAITNQEHIAMEEIGSFARIDKDLRKLRKIMDDCRINQALLTDDGLLVEFPDQFHRRPQHTTFLRDEPFWFRSKRDVSGIQTGNNEWIEFDIGQNFSTPLIWRLYGKKNIRETAKVSRIIEDRVLLREFNSFNVSNIMLQHRAKFYPEDRRHPQNFMLIALKSIRIAQYARRQRKVLTELKRKLTFGEETMLQMIDAQDPFMFDSLLEKEFGESKFDSSNLDPSFLAPQFNLTLMKKEARIPPFDEASWTPPKLPARVNTHIPPNTSTTPSPSRTVKTTPHAIPTIPTTPKEDLGTPVKSDKKSIEEIFANTCKDQYATTTLFETLLSIDPTAAVRQLLKRKDILAKIIGDSILISKCRKIFASTIHWDRKVDGTCYDLIPVTVDGVLWFQLPGSEDLVGVAVKIPCSERPPGIRLEFNRWIDPDNRETSPQHLIRPNKMSQEQFLLEAPSTFYTTLNEETGVSTGSDKENEKRSSRYQRDLEKTLIETGVINDGINLLTETTTKIRKSAKEAFDSTIDNIGSRIQKVFFSVVQLIIWISSPIICIAVLICCGYGYFKYRAFKKATRRAKKTAISATEAIVGLAQQMRINNVQMEANEPRIPNIRRPMEHEYPLIRVNAIRINSVKAVRLPHIDVDLEGARLDALLDTGAAVSYLPISSVVTRVETKHQPKAHAANGSAINFLGTTKATLRMGNIIIPHNFLVSLDCDCPAPLLIGSDIIKKINKLGHDFNINLHESKLRIGESTIPINFISPEEERILVYPEEEVILEPHAETIVPTIIRNYDREMGDEFVMEDTQEDSDDIYVVGRSIDRVSEFGRTMIQIFNPSATQIRLDTNKPIAIASKVGAVTTMDDLKTSPEGDWESRLPRLPQETPENFRMSDLVNLSVSALTDEEKEEMRNIIDRHPGAFVGPDGILGEYNGEIKHRVDLEEGAPIPKAKIYRIPLEKRTEIEKQIRMMLEQRIIRPSDSPFLAPIVIVKKADGKSWRFTVDFRGLNAITKPVQSVIPNIQEIIDLCGGQELYTSLDFQAGFHQIQRNTHTELLSLASWEPLSICACPWVSKAPRDIRARVFVYIDDLILTSESTKQHLLDVDEVLGKIESIGMRLKPEKCMFAVRELIFLGFIVSKDGIKPDPKKITAMIDFPTPKNVKDVRAFIGMSSFYRRFVKNFSTIAAPIIELTKKDSKFEWTPERAAAFEEMKKALTSEPVLVAPRLGKPFVIEVDASAKGAGAVLYQQQDEDGKDLRVVAYASRVYNKYEKNYPAIELEAVGLVFAVKTFRPYIDGAKTKVITDHSPLRSLMYRKELQGRLGKYQIVLQEWNCFMLGEAKNWVILLPTKSPYGRKLAKLVHESLFESAHLGRDKTENRLRSLVSFPGLSKTVRIVVDSCQVCQRNKDSTKNRIRAPLGKFDETTKPFERVHSDFIGPLEETTRKNKFIAVFVDAFSKFMIAEPVENQLAETLCEVFKNRVVARFGTPKLLVTDQGTNYTSNLFRDMLKTMQVEHRMSTPHHHQANGQVERANQTIETMLRQCEVKNDWDREIHTLVHAYNNAHNATTGVTPHMVIHGQDARSPLKNLLPERTTAKKAQDYVKEIQSIQGTLQEKCKEKIEKKTNERKMAYDSIKEIRDTKIS
uniref:RNA-directed DNA polymerase n=1 Tax=Caenorhabditis japonica TaxID=281687 RepID=A0A8R1EB09_CAEJA